MRRATSGQILLGFALFASLAYSVYIVRQTDATFRRTESAPAIVLKALTTHTDTRPNIIVIMADDLDDGLFQTLINGGHLPNLKTNVVDAGTTFSNSFVATSLCCPSRATFLTGQYSHNHGVLFNEGANGGVARLDDDSTLATWLHDAGYIVGHIGKYLNGYGSNSGAPITSPLNPKYVPPGYDYWRGLVDPSTYKVYNYKINFDGSTVKTYGTGAANYQTDVLSGMAVNFINGVEPYDAMPFFLFIAPLTPHQETSALTSCITAAWARTIRPAPRHVGSLSALVLPQPPSFNESDVSDKPPYVAQQPLMTAQEIGCAGAKYRARAEALRAVDDMVGNVFNALAAKGELENTVFVFTSDNGFYLGQHRLANKVVGYEEGIRVPLIIRAPGYTPGQQTTRYALNTDLAPTISAFAGVTQTLVVDGRSLIPVLQNPVLTDWRRRFLVEFLGGTPYDFSSVRTTDLDAAVPEIYYSQWLGGSLEYYDLSIDPYQLVSKHNDPATASQRQILAGHLVNLQNCGNGSCQVYEDAP